MAIRKNRPMGFVDAALEEFGSTRTTKLLDRLAHATPWTTLSAPIAALPMDTREGSCRLPWNPAAMLRRLMLAKWFGLSDPGLEDALLDRISFRKFVGLSFTDEGARRDDLRQLSQTLARSESSRNDLRRGCGAHRIARLARA